MSRSFPWERVRSRTDARILTLCFFLSGFAGLAYQMVWTRLAFASFGINVQVLSVVISVFMGGLLLGSLWGSRIAQAARRQGISPLVLYALIEAFVGFGALCVPSFFGLGHRFLLASGGMDGAAYGVLSAAALSLSILPFCVAMGMTYPVVMTHLREVLSPEDRETSFSRLYVGNLAGALSGVLVTAFIAVELLGFRGSLWMALGFNLLASALAVLRARKAIRVPLAALGLVPRGEARSDPAWSNRLLFWSGFCSMGMEVVWTRAFTPVLRTQVYSFASLLAVYLASSALGSALYRRQRREGRVLDFSSLIALVAVTALLPVILNDPRFHFSPWIVLASIVPFCGTLGYLTPRLVDEASSGMPERAGRSYAVNLAGCILGPLAVGYGILPAWGAKHSLLLLTVPLILIFGLRVIRAQGPRIREAVWGSVMALLLFVAMTHSLSFEEFFPGVGGRTRILRDPTATVVVGGEGMDKSLFVNGIGITSLTTITKYMAHLPLATLEREPRSALVLCLGMGTSYRSALSWGIDTTAVELVPSVKEFVTFFHPDLAGKTDRPGALVVVDDGRRFLERTSRKYDVIIIDPPPPVEAAGSSLLYSCEFYTAARRRLEAGGILQQWYPGDANIDTLPAVARALAESFPFVKVTTSHARWGFHFLASDRPLRIPDFEQAWARMPLPARKDLAEWRGEEAKRRDFRKVLLQAKDIPILVSADPAVVITDDRPFNEYFLLRRLR